MLIICLVGGSLWTCGCFFVWVNATSCTMKRIGWWFRHQVHVDRTKDVKKRGTGRGVWLWQGYELVRYQ